MQPGPDRIVACPHCKGLSRHGTLASGNNLGAVAWTDGFWRAPMLPRPPAVVQCVHCETAFWLADAEEVELRQHSRAEPAPGPGGAFVARAAEPTEGEYYEAIARGLAKDDGQLSTLRILAWWRSNEWLREDWGEDAAADVESSARRGENLEALWPLLDDSEEPGALLKAEVLRELGRFEAAKECLATITSRAWVGEVRQLARLCDEGNTRVQRRESEQATCPRCGEPLRTPFARQCRVCGADWH
jgi:hypothetical protein